MFEQAFENVTSQLAAVFGGQVVYYAPVDSENDPCDLENVIIGDVRHERRKSEYGFNIYQVRYFQLVSDETNSRYSGIASVAMGGRFMVGDGDDGEEWPIVMKPAVSSDGFLKCRCERFLRHEVGNPSVRGGRG